MMKSLVCSAKKLGFYPRRYGAMINCGGESLEEGGLVRSSGTCLSKKKKKK